MSYLHLPCLVFSGDFKSDVSTVNNDPAHYNNETFKPNFQDFGVGATNGWWNPEGGASFLFLNCRVEQVAFADGKTATDAAEDIVVGQIVGHPVDKSPGKMVDLDPDEQGSSELWAVTLRIATNEGELLLQGDIKPTAFRDLQTRQHHGANVNGQALGGSWTSVLTNLVWGEKASKSPFLRDLKTASEASGKLSLNLNAFGYYYTHAADGRFSLGRILGSIAPWFEKEPELFAPARRLYGIVRLFSVADFGARGAKIYFNDSNFLFEKENKRLTLDLGASFPVDDALGRITNIQKFIVAVAKSTVAFLPGINFQTLAPNDFIEIGKVDYQSQKNWLDETGGIARFENLSDEAANQLADHQLLLLTPSAGGKFIVVAREGIGGYLVRADNFVQRLDANQTNEVDFYAYQWGKPLAEAEIAITMQPPTDDTPVGPGNPISIVYGNNKPPEGLTFLSSVKTDADGHARLAVTGNPIHSPRHYIDGQIYTLDYKLANVPEDPAASGPFAVDVIFVHLRDYFETAAENPAWSEIAATMTQFGNLYPIMSKYIVDFSDPVAVKAKKDILIFAFTRDINDPLHMPVTRDLSDAKRQAILKWLAATDLNLGEKKTKDFSVEKASESVQPPESVADAPRAELTDKQIKLRDAARAKSGAELTDIHFEQQ